ncbi:MAG: hypothetical protein ACI4JM_10085, partial [Oscillospiraceae bacterium]
CQTFSKKSLCERSSQNRNHQISIKPQRATNGRPYIVKKVWAAESRLMKFPINRNGRPVVALEISAI